MQSRWSALRKLIWLKIALDNSISKIWRTITGEPPIVLSNALSAPIRSLVRYGKCEQSATPKPSKPVDIVCNNGALAYGPQGKNLFDPAAHPIGQGAISSATGADSASGARVRTVGYIPVKPDTNYCIQVKITGVTTAKVFVLRYPNASTDGYANKTSGWQDSGYTFNTGDGINYVRFVFAKSDGSTVSVVSSEVEWVMLEEGQTASEYEPFVGGIKAVGTPERLIVSASGATDQTATVPDLLSVGTYMDEADIVSGSVVRRCGIRALDGTETGWTRSDSGSTHRFRGTKPRDCYTPVSRAPSLSTHFKSLSTGSAVGGMFIGASSYWYFIPADQSIDTVEGWTAWLAEQYEAGTPVIVIYPLAEEIAESVEAQALSTSDGDNTVRVTANVSVDTVKATYCSGGEI